MYGDVINAGLMLLKLLGSDSNNGLKHLIGQNLNLKYLNECGRFKRISFQIDQSHARNSNSLLSSARDQCLYKLVL